jgi:putative DNA methylase
MPLAHIREQAKQGKMTYQLMAMVAGSNGRRVYLDPDEAHARVADSCRPSWKPDCEMPKKHRNFQPPVYGMDNLGDLFTPRQLVALTTIGAIIEEAHAKITQDTSGDRPYADAIVTYLSCALSRMTDYHSNLTTWNPTNANVRCLFQRQAIPMAWDFCEANPIHGKLSFAVAADWVASAIGSVAVDGGAARVTQLDARKARPTFASQPVISTDPPYYDNISYADLADFFYVWLRFTLKRIDPQTFATLLTPKEPELIASPTRHGSMERAQEHFRNGFRHVFRSLLESGHPSTPITIYYAFKQHEDDDERGGDGHRASSGWETMLEGLSESGFQITGTWPVRTTKKARAVALGANALASAVVLVVRRRHESAPMATRKEFVAELKKELPSAIGSLTQASIAPVDLAQASIGPGMAVFTRYAKVLEAEGTPMSVRTALQIINQELDAYLVAQEGEMDRDTRFCLAWFEQHGMNEGAFGEADVLARAKNTSVQGLVDGGVLKARAGKVRVLRRTEYQKDWDPAQDGRLTVWECAQHLILQLNTKGEEGAAQLCRRLGGGRSEDARALAYRLYSICERKGRSEEALAYNSLVVSWPAIQERAAQLAKTSRQSELFQ